jgi:probable HAF family extracellular repeat protein
MADGIHVTMCRMWRTFRLIDVMAVLALVASAVAVPASSALAAPVEYRVVELGPPAGFDTVTGAGINESGQVVGTVQVSPYGQTSAFVWDSATGLRVLGRFNNRGTTGRGINDRGEITGGSPSGSVYDPGTPVVWSAATGFQALTGLGTGTGINDAGQVSGTVGIGPRAVRWPASGESQALGALGGEEGSALGINNRGQVIGWARTANYYPHPFLWDPATGMRDLGTFQADGSGTGTAYAVNDVGHVVGSTSGSGPSALSQAFLWRDGRLTAIGPQVSFAYAVNDLDHAVGQALVGSVYRAFLFRDGQSINLNTLIPGGRIVLTAAQGIDDAGRIVANGTNAQGQQRAFVLIPS